MDEERYEIEATDPKGTPQKLSVQAGSVSELVENLRKEELQVSKLTGSRARKLFEPRKCNLEDFAMFNAELAAACKRGVPLPGAIRAFSKDIAGKRTRRALAEVADEVEGGTDLAQAFKRHSEVFPPGYVVLVDAGLKSGNLADALLLIADEIRLTGRLRRKIMEAIVYPLIVMLAASFFIAYTAWAMLPDFSADFGVATTRMRKLMFALVPLFRYAPVVLVAAAAAVAGICIVVWRRVSWSASIGRFIIKVPVIGRFMRALATTRFCRTVAGAVVGNVPLPDAIMLGGLSTGNAAFREETAKIADRVREGRTLSDAVEIGYPIFPHSVVWMFSLGEERGELAPALEESARLQEDQVQRIGDFMPLMISALLVGLAASFVLMAGMLVFTSIIRYMGVM